MIACSKMSDGTTPEELLAVVRRVREILAEAPEAPAGPKRTLRSVIDASKAGGPVYDRAEAMLTEALGRFPLHPYLLSWRANVRLPRFAGDYIITEDSLIFQPSEGAIDDLVSAAEVAPDYHQPTIDLAYHTLNQLDDAKLAEQLFRRVTTRLTESLCDSAAGHIEALAEIDPGAAHGQLAIWLGRFPDSTRLHEAADRLDLHDRSD